MQLENSFQVSAPPEKVFAYLLDINKVVGCVPGAELSASRTAKLTADGRETTGPGSAQVSATMKVQTAGDGSLVEIVTEYQVRGRVANFGRGVMEDVSKRLIKDMANCIQANLEADDPAVEDDVAAAVERSTPAAATAPRAGATAAPVSAFALVWHLIKLRVARLFGRT